MQEYVVSYTRFHVWFAKIQSQIQNLKWISRQLANFVNGRY